LRSLRKLEEMEIRREEKNLQDERSHLKKLLKDEGARWQAIEADVAKLKITFGKNTKLGARRTEIAEAPADIMVPVEAVIERENVTVLCSAKGWIRAQKGHVATDRAAREAIKYKEGDEESFVMNAETTDKILLLAGNGRFYTLAVDKLPGGRGFGEPVRMMVEMPQDAEIVCLFKYQEGMKLVVASDDGRGFIVEANEILAQTKNGKQVLNVGDGAKAVAAAVVTGDHLAVAGTNRKVLIFPLAEIPVMARGRGVILQKYKDGQLSDVKCFTLKQGLSWKSGDKERVETDLRAYVGTRAQAGRIAPNGFPRSNRFGN
jgi:topoisomerase IV subunit A